MSNEIRKRLTSVDHTHSFDSVIVNDGSKLRQITKNELEKIINIDGVVEEVSGTAISLRDSAKAPFRGMKLFGKSTQKKTTGKNLFKVTAPATYNGVTLSQKDDYYVLNGTATQSALFITKIGTLEAGTYALSANNPKHNSLGDTYVPIIQVYSPTTLESIAAIDDEVNKVSIGTIKGGEDFETRIRIQEGITYDNFIIKPQFEKNSVVTEYEPYTGGKSSPRPDWEQDIASIENPTAIVMGKNLFKVVELTANGVTISKYQDYYVLNGTCTQSHNFGVKIGHLPAGTYTLRANNPVHNNVYFSICDIYSDVTKQVIAAFDNIVYSTKTVELKEADDWIARIRIEKGVTYNNYIVKPQLEFGAEATVYEPYKEPQIIQLTHTLPGIQVTSGGNYVDADGQQWICDEIDLERGVYIQRIRERVLDGTESWQKNDEADATKYLYFLRINDAGATTCMCDKLQMKSSNTLNKSGTSHDFMGILASSAYQVIYLNLNMLMTENTVSGLKSALHENPLTVIYPLLTPIEIPLTDEELSAYIAATTNHLNTTILNNAGAHMEVVYSVDLKTCINDFKNAIVGIESYVTLLANRWTVSDDGYFFTQEVTIPNTTVKSRIEQDPTPAQLIYLLQSEISIFFANDNGTIVAYALNAVPEIDMTLKVIRREVYTL